MIPIHDNLSSVAECYDGFIIDLWGVLHDGVRAFPAAVACLEELHRRSKRIAILSNAPRRAAEVAERCVKLGIPAHLYHGVMSSGEETWRHLAERPDAWYRALGRRCYHIGPARDRGMRDGLDYDFVEEIGAADFILTTGALLSEDTAAQYDPLLKAALGRGLPMICANPDLAVIRGGQREVCAGAIALRFEELGGEARYHGKPHAAIYGPCFSLLGNSERGDIERGRIAAIGDSLRTDIAGANGVGIDSIFITGGLQGAELGADGDGNADPVRLAALCESEGQRPSLALPLLRW